MYCIATCRLPCPESGFIFTDLSAEIKNVSSEIFKVLIDGEMFAARPEAEKRHIKAGLNLCDQKVWFLSL